MFGASCANYSIAFYLFTLSGKLERNVIVSR